MSYEKQVWTDGVSPLNAERMNHMEQGIADAHQVKDWSAYGLPIIYLIGDTTGMTKDDYVDLVYTYGERIGTVSVKWQGSSSLAYPKKNYTMKFDTAFEAMTGWGEQKKYCFKANWIDHSHARNVVNAKLWGQIVKSRANVPDRLKNLVNGGAVDGFPCIIVLNGEFLGLYTWNIPKDGWMLGMGAEGGSANTATGTFVDIEAEEGGALTVSGETTESVTLVHHGKNFMPCIDAPITKYGVTLTPNEDGSITFSGTNGAGNSAYIDLFSGANPFYLPAGTYMLSGQTPGLDDGCGIFVMNADGGAILGRLSGGLTTYRIVLSEGTWAYVSYNIPADVTVNGTVSLQIEQGTTVTDFEKGVRTEQEGTLPMSVNALAGQNFLYTTTGDEITVTTDGGKMETILCAEGNSTDFAIEGFKAPVTEWGVGFEVEFMADESAENQTAMMTSVNNLINACINSDGTDLDTTIAEMLDWQSAIDYYIFATLIAGHDMQTKNYLLYTFNGKKWYFGGYDMDCTYGLYWNGGSWVSAAYPARFDTMALSHRLFYLIQNYKKEEVKARYEELRNSTMSEGNIYLMFSNFCGAIPKGVYLADAERWPTTPNTSGNDVSQILNYYRMRVAGADVWVESMHR